MGLFSFNKYKVMAVGKNKGLSKGGKKGAKKKIVDPFTRKDWYDIKAPSIFKVRDVGKTLVNRTQGTRIASDGLKGRVYEVSLADLQSESDAERSFRKFRFICEDVQGKNCFAQSQQVRQIRKKMTDIITREVSSSDLKELVNKLIPDSMSVDITKACQGIYPLHDVHIRKVKVMKRPRFDLHKLMELHGETGKTTTTTDPNTGEVVTRAEGYEPPVLDAV